MFLKNPLITLFFIMPVVGIIVALHGLNFMHSKAQDARQELRLVQSDVDTVVIRQFSAKTAEEKAYWDSRLKGATERLKIARVLESDAVKAYSKMNNELNLAISSAK